MKWTRKENLFPFTENNKRYHTLDYFYKKEFHSKIFKVSLNAGFTCPNIDGTVGTGGCIYCSHLGSGDFAGNEQDDLITQFEQVKNTVCKKWPNSKYIGYFQAHTNTYADIDTLKEKYESILKLKDVVGLSIATRADAITEECLTYLEELSKRTFLTVELGLQTIHEETSKLINRCHTLECFEHMVFELRKRNINVVVHIMNGLPNETKEMMLDTIRYLNKLDINGIKIHMLHVLKNTKLGQLYLENPFPILTKEEYVDIVCDQLELLRPDIVIHRITGDPKKEDLISPDWLLKKFDVLNSIDKELVRRNTYQGFGLSSDNFRKKIISENLRSHDHVYSFDTSLKTLQFLCLLTPKGVLKTADDTNIYDLQNDEKGKLSFIYCNEPKLLCRNNITIWLSLLNSKGIILIESSHPNKFYKEIGEEIFFLDTYFYIIKKN